MVCKGNCANYNFMSMYVPHFACYHDMLIVHSPSWLTWRSKTADGEKSMSFGSFLSIIAGSILLGATLSGLNLNRRKASISFEAMLFNMYLFVSWHCMTWVGSWAAFYLWRLLSTLTVWPVCYPCIGPSYLKSCIPFGLFKCSLKRCWAEIPTIYMMFNICGWGKIRMLTLSSFWGDPDSFN